MDEAKVVDIYVTKDSGDRQGFDSGAVRDVSTDKGRFDLLPPLAIRRLALLYERGSLKYADRNWEKGMPTSRMADSMLRHAFQVLEGVDDEDHLAAVAWNALGIIEFRERIKRGLLPKELDDLPKLG